MKILLLANTAWYLYNYRLPLIKRLTEDNNQIVLASPDDPYVEALQDMGYHWSHIPIRRRSINPLGELPTLQAIRKLYRIVQPELVHHFTIKPVLYGSILASRIGIPATVNSIPGRGYLFTSDSARARIALPFALHLYRLALRQPNSAAIFQNREDLSVFTELNLVRQEQTRLLPGSGVDLDVFRYSEEQRDVPIVVMASRMLIDKGVYDLVEAARILKEREPRLQVILAGAPDDGNPNSIDEAILRSWNEEGVVQWIGHIEDMPALLAKAQIAVLPTYYGEGIPRSLVEGAAIGRALIGSDVPACREIIQDGENGLLVEARNPEALAQAIQTLLEQPELRRAMGVRGRKMVEEKFSAENVVSSTLTIYDELLSGSLPSSDEVPQHA